MPPREIILYACGSDIIVDFLEVCLKNDIKVKSIIHNLPNKIEAEFDYASVENYDFSNEQTPFLVPLFSSHNRYKASQEAIKMHHLIPFGLLSDRNNDLPVKFEYGKGCFINKRVVFGSHSKIGDFVLVNRGACLGHHAVLEDYASIGPGVVTGGRVTVKKGALVGTGAVILPEVTIGQHAMVGAGSVVAKSVPDYAVVIGNPARHTRDNENVF